MMIESIIKCHKCDEFFPEDHLHPFHPVPHYCAQKRKPDSEFQLIEKSTQEAQKCINQWRHDYHIEIVSVQASPTNGWAIIALWRTPK